MNVIYAMIENHQRGNSVSGVNQEILFNRYKGLEGYARLLQSNDELDNQQKLLKSERNSDSQRLICLSRDQNIELQNKEFTYIGIDYGFFNEGHDVYSSIYNEIIFGITNELKAFQNRLNQFSLFNDNKVADDYIGRHHECLIKNLDVEQEDGMYKWNIWLYI